MAKAKLPKPDYVRKLVDYDPDTGILTWKPRTAADMAGSMSNAPELQAHKFNLKHAGMLATKEDMRYGQSVTKLTVRIGGTPYGAHRIAWVCHYGEWPQESIDHINGDPHDNRIANLRLATHAENARNTSSRYGSSSDYLGVCEYRGKWRAQIHHAGQLVVLGVFDDEEDAAVAYDCAAVTFFREFANPSTIRNPFVKKLKRVLT